MPIKEMDGEKIVICPVCGGHELRVHQLTWNTQDYNPLWSDDKGEDEWGANEYGEGDYEIAVFCATCKDRDNKDTDLTALAVEAGWRIYDESSLKRMEPEPKLDATMAVVRALWDALSEILEEVYNDDTHGISDELRQKGLLAIEQAQTTFPKEA